MGVSAQRWQKTPRVLRECRPGVNDIIRRSLLREINELDASVNCRVRVRKKKKAHHMSQWLERLRAAKAQHEHNTQGPQGMSPACPQAQTQQAAGQTVCVNCGEIQEVPPPTPSCGEFTASGLGCAACQQAQAVTLAGEAYICPVCGTEVGKRTGADAATPVDWEEGVI